MESKDSITSLLEGYITRGDAQTIARQLRMDQDSCAHGRLPTLLAINLKERKRDRNLSLKIATCLHSETTAIELPPSILLLQYDSILDGIKAHIHQLEDEPLRASQTAADIPLPSKSNLDTALLVLTMLVDTSKLSVDSSLSSVISQIRKLSTETGEDGLRGQTIPDSIMRRCYICHISLHRGATHPAYTSLCQPCGAFNILSSELSLPQNLILENKTALVTGARLNLGFHTAVRLLRSGARVIATSRYPGDAEKRYGSQPDFETWKSRLMIVGADFRAAKDVFNLVSVVKTILTKWSDEQDMSPRLDILVNNAAQTLTDSIDVEQQAIENEIHLQTTGSLRLVQSKGGYIPRIRGGALPLNIEAGAPRRRPDEFLLGKETGNDNLVVEAPDKIEVMRRWEKRPLSSWTQTVSNIPYEDFISAHSVNAFVPLILIRELLPSMGKEFSRNPHVDSTIDLLPAGYILNVSSREGIFDTSESAGRQRKTEHHVHTNMSKAALNMITETEAARCWHDRRVCMNSVDPGYMSSAPGFGSDLPIGWEDGAGRVLWPVAVGWGMKEVEGCKGMGRAVWGKFLKHFRPARWGGEDTRTASTPMEHLDMNHE